MCILISWEINWLMIKNKLWTKWFISKHLYIERVSGPSYPLSTYFLEMTLESVSWKISIQPGWSEACRMNNTAIHLYYN